MSAPKDKAVRRQSPSSGPSAVADIVTAALVVIGDEILSGRTADLNISHIASFLNETGINLVEVRIVPDNTDEIVKTVRALRKRATYVFTTGGIGPTHDDITADAIAKALGRKIDVDERALALMRPYYERKGLELTPSRLRMARIPEGATLIKNRVSIAPGFMIENVIVMAGVPKIMQVMLDDVAQHLKTGRPMLSKTVKLLTPEGEVADLFAEHQKAYPDVGMGSYPRFSDGRLSCDLVLRSIDAHRLQAAYDDLEEKLKAADIS